VVESSSKMRLKESEARILLLCMIAMASADNKLHANETRVISSVFEKLIGTPLDEAFLREIFELSRYNRVAVLDEGSLTGFSPQLKRLIVKSCYLVKIADRTITESELDMLATIAARLGMSETELSSAIREATSG
jgi:uncharacterized tellurite resistance protein B-like protein